MRSLPATGLAEAHAVYGISLDPVSARPVSALRKRC